ncbi:MAG: ABC transporter ATP-binding protein [Ignavibacteriae bacterium]|nr:ABC transporter ATP-binding protein [Ignavibacteria bacterium]MBI3364177.1 ABC transporter ATP-binding protein [Ignavibacteriota bacterium]
MIELIHLTKTFGSFTAVHDLTLTINPGEFFGFLGPNGAGKTTTIKMMTGLFTPASGQVRINGIDIQAEPERAKRNIGYIPDQPFLYEKLTGREFLYFSAGLYNVHHADIAERIRKLTEAFEIGAWIDRRTESYSQGMRQRIAITAALLHDPTVLIVDEPMVGLDPRSAYLVKQVLKERSKAGVSIFMSTHSLPVVEELCDRVGIIKEGILVFEDTAGSFEIFRDKYNGSFETLFLELTR